MKSLNLYSLAYHGAGVLIVVFIGAYVARSAFYVETASPCSKRYPAGMQFALQTNDGALMSPPELQARVGLPERGVLENTKIVSVSEGSSRVALEVKLANVTSMAKCLPCAAGRQLHTAASHTCQGGKLHTRRRHAHVIAVNDHDTVTLGQHGGNGLKTATGGHGIIHQ